MNELTVKPADLPALATEEVKQCVDLIGDAIQALKSKRNAAGHIGANKAVIDEMDAQIREYSAMKLKAEIELGKRTAAMPKAVKGNQFTGKRSVQGADEPKETALRSMGMTKQRASDYERMAKHETYVEQYIDRKLELGQTPTRHEVMREIKHYDRPDTPVQAAKKAIREIQGAKVVDIEALDTLKEKQSVVDNDTAETTYKRLMDAIGTLVLYSSASIDDVTKLCKILEHDRAARLKRSLEDVSAHAFRIIKRMEGE